jgi:hypothetical protein
VRTSFAVGSTRGTLRVAMSPGSRPPDPDARKTQPPAGYEFSDASKESFRALAASTSFVGVCTMLLGGLSCVFLAGALYTGFVPSAIGPGALAVGTAALAIVCLTTAWWMVSAGRSLSALVTTRGRDVEHLMGAVRQLRRFFGLARVVIVAVSLVVMIAGGVVVWCNLVLDRGGKCLGLWW